MPQLFIGNKKVKDICKGSTRINKIYKGETLIYKFFKGLYIYIEELVYTNVKFNVYVSKDLINWTLVFTTATTDKYHYPTFSINSDMIVICENRALSGTETKKFWYSYDGYNWSAYQKANMEKTCDLVCLNNKFYFLPGNGRYNYIYQSIDGLNWEKKYLGNYQANIYPPIIYDFVHNNIISAGGHLLNDTYYYGYFIISEDFSNITFIGGTSYTDDDIGSLCIFNNDLYRTVYESNSTGDYRYSTYLEKSTDGGYNWIRTGYVYNSTNYIPTNLLKTIKGKLYLSISTGETIEEYTSLFFIVESSDGINFENKGNNFLRANTIADDDYLYTVKYDSQNQKKVMYKGRNLDELEIYIDNVDTKYVSPNMQLWRQEEFNT